MKVNEVMLTIDRFPVVSGTVIFKEALEEMSRLRLGIACIVDPSNKLLGILTDGDIRRKVLNVQKPFSALLADDALVHSIQSPTTAQPDDTLERAIEIMEKKQIWDLPVVNSSGVLVGLLHLHPVVEALLKTYK